MTLAAQAGVAARSTGLSSAVVGVVVLLLGCGSSAGTATSAAIAPTRTPLVGHDAIDAPRAIELRPGTSVRVRRSVVPTVGWQVGCFARGRRVNAEAVRGQTTGAGEVVGFKGGSPSIWVKHNRDGSITVSCR
jgi:hypothetical protein